MQKLIETALQSIRDASRICIDVQAELVTADSVEKGDRSPVTVADFAAQAVVADALAEAFPDIPLVGEEDSAALKADPEMCDRVRRHAAAVRPRLDDAAALCDAIDRGADPGGASGRFWTLDPIDGTKGFLRRGQYAVALALIEDGEVVFGGMGCPNLDGGLLFSAEKGQGSYMGSLERGASAAPIHVAAKDDAATWRFCESVESGHSDHGRAQKIAKKLAITTEPLRMDSQCKYGIVGRGDASIYLRLPTSADYIEKIWDHAAGTLIVESAGGTVTDVLGTPLDFSQGRTLSRNRGVIATNGHAHEAVLAAVAEFS